MNLNELKTKKWFKVASNMYVMVLTVFVIWMLFFDTNSLLIHWELKKKINNLEKIRQYLKEEIGKDKVIFKKLSDKEELKKFAREQYFLKRQNEEIYLIEYEDSLNLKDEE